jgi:exopolysaccharide biosynthesis polyprenyl glycosylphosphotransferase
MIGDERDNPRRGGSRSVRDRFRRRHFGRSEGARIARSPLLMDEPASPANQRRDRAFRVAIIVADVAAAAIVVGLLLAWLPVGDLSWTVLCVLVVLPLVHAVNGLYRRDAQVLNKSTLDEAPVLFGAATMTTIVCYLFQSGVLVRSIGAHVVGSIWLGLTICVPVCRVLARAAVREWLPPERCLVVGDSDQGRRLAAKLENAGPIKSRLVGVMPLAVAGSGPGPGALRLSRLAETIERLDVHRVVIAADAAPPQFELETIQAAKALGVKVSVLPRVLEVVGSSATYDFVDGLTILGVPRFGLSRTAELSKRVFDIAGSAVALLLLAPLMIGIAVAVATTSRGPVLFRQTRIGRGGQPFSMLKFRSMQDGAERLKPKLMSRNEQEGVFKIADDPRVTRVGRWLRRLSLDELPQLYNVLRGEMGLVGPRPLVPEEDARIQGWHRRRLHLTPGVTGPWQVLGSARIPMAEMVTIDYLYVANWSLWNDVKIMLRTVGTVVARRGR